MELDISHKWHRIKAKWYYSKTLTIILVKMAIIVCLHIILHFRIFFMTSMYHLNSQNNKKIILFCKLKTMIILSHGLMLLLHGNNTVRNNLLKRKYNLREIFFGIIYVFILNSALYFILKCFHIFKNGNNKTLQGCCKN